MTERETEGTAAPQGLGWGAKAAIVFGLALLVTAVLIFKQNSAGVPATPRVGDVTGLPRLVELGSVSCIPCKLMAPILDELRKEYPGALQVDFIDVNKDPEREAEFGIRIWPTQVFLDADGKELFRHEGFIPKADILAKWKELGVNLTPSAETPVK